MLNEAFTSVFDGNAARLSEFSSYEIELRNRVTQNDVTNSKMFIEILLSSYQLDFTNY